MMKSNVPYTQRHSFLFIVLLMVTSMTQNGMLLVCYILNPTSFSHFYKQLLVQITFVFYTDD